MVIEWRLVADAPPERQMRRNDGSVYGHRWRIGTMLARPGADQDWDRGPWLVGQVDDSGGDSDGCMSSDYYATHYSEHFCDAIEAVEYPA